jgi:sec-independent protein translocase protein TatA
MFNIGPTELIVIVIIALIVFGPRRLPEIGRTVGKSMREFRQASQDLKNEFNINLDDDIPGDRPVPGEPGYANWKAGEQPPAANGGSEGPNGSAANSATAALTAGVGLGVAAAAGGEPKDGPGGAIPAGVEGGPTATIPIESAPSEPEPASELTIDLERESAPVDSVDVQPDAADPAARDDTGTEAAG